MPPIELIEQVVTVHGPREGAYTVTLETLRHDPYPPPATLERRRLSFVGATEVVARAEAAAAASDPVGPIAAAVDADLARAPLGRLTLALPAALQPLAWEEQLVPRIAPAVVMRRHPGTAGERTHPLDVPVDFAVVLSGGASQPMPFDTFVDDAARAGAVRIRVADEPGTPDAEVHHVAFADPSALRGALAPSLERPPILLVVQGPAFDGLVERVWEALDAGADAVLWAGEQDEFFRSFYRKVMHNLPLDWAVHEAIKAVGVPVPIVFGARVGGEFGLLLARAAARPLVRNGGPDPAAVLDAATHGRGFGAGSGLPRHAHRRVRAADEAGRDVVEAADVALDDAASTIVRGIESERFDLELHAIERVRLSRETADEIVYAIAPDIDRVLAAAAEPPASVPERPLRLTNVWITTGGRGGGQTVDALTAQRPYRLHLEIAPHAREGAIVAAPIDETRIREQLNRGGVWLDVTLFSPPDGFAFSQRRFRLFLPKGDGPTRTITARFTIATLGVKRVRVTVSYRNVVLQSVLVEATVADPARPGEGSILARTLDYLASSDLALMGELPPPALSIVTNHADGTHWIGLVSSGAAGGIPASRGALYELPDLKLDGVANLVRSALLSVESDPYRYSSPFAPDVVEERCRALAELAFAGWEAFHTLFLTGAGDPREDESLAARAGRVISVARCHGSEAGVPWAALYDQRLVASSASELTVCQVFRDQLAANVWAGTELQQTADFLDDPVKCAAQDACPLKSLQMRRRTVCPFGFWGIRSQVELPIQHVRPTPVGEVPSEVAGAPFDQTPFVERLPGEDVRLTMGVFPTLTKVQDHRDAIRTAGEKAFTPEAFTLDYFEENVPMRDALITGGAHVYYFFCHGVSEGGTFKLRLGPAPAGGDILASNFSPGEDKWEPVHSLVLINGCETAALTPDLIGNFMDTLRAVGASGVVGTEIKVWTDLARPFGLRVLERLFAGASLGEAFLDTRRHFMRQLNPLGLAYTFYAPAALHLHSRDGACRWCTRNGL